MVANNSTTLAVEVPIWLTADEPFELERQYGALLRAPNVPPNAAIAG